MDKKINNLETDSSLGHYRIVSKIGAGGMGEVYLAEDTKLHRKVALKILPPEFAADLDRMDRFVREARSASALNHPNIITIHEIGESEGTHYIVTEFIDGKTLNDYAKSNPLNLKSALEIAVQIASALDEAHQAGIVHRDIKPDNVMVRSNGLAKILDFGIAKLSAPTETGEEAATAIQAQTQAGMIIGTPNYMSPEQARGKVVDHQTDIFSFGVVLYEMLAGNSPFAGETVSDVIAAVLTKEAQPLENIPIELADIVDKTLQKDKQNRYQTAKDLLHDLKEVKQELEIQSRLGRNSAPNLEEPKTQILKAQTTAESETQNSIAVLPFTNMSADEDNEYFCDGLAEELLNALSKIEDLKVAARTSAFSFKGKNANISEIGEKLSVKNVLEGSVRRSGNKLRISVQLVNVADGYHLWSERYDREMKDILDVQDEITLAVVDALKLELLGDEKAAVLKRYTDNQEVYQLYLKGRFFWNKRTDESLRKAVGYFQQAIEIDPNYALAHAGLADSYFYLGYNFGFMPPDEAMPKAISAARMALELDKNLGEAYCSSGLVKLFYEWDLAGAAEDLQSSIALSPNYPLGYHIYGFYLAAIHGKFDEAIVEAKKALNLEPLSIPLYNIVALLLLDARHYDEAISIWRKAIEIAPNNAGLYNDCGWAYELQEKYDEAFENYLRALELSGETGEEIENFRRLYKSAGIRGIREWQVNFSLNKWEERNHWHGDAYAIAVNYSRLGEKEQALRWLEKAFELRSGLLIWLKIHPAFDCLRNYLRFQNLLKRIGLPTDETAQDKTTNEASEARAGILSPAATNANETPANNSKNDELASPAKPKTKTKWWLFGMLSLVILVAGFFAYRYFTPANKQIESIAVMPFVNESGNADVEYLSDGMTETLISSLSQLPKLNVKARSSVFRYKGRETDAQTVGRELNVQAILNGRIVQRGDNLTLYLSLVDAQTGNQIWGEPYNRKMIDLVSLQSEIARDVSQKLKTKLSGADEQRLVKNYTKNPEAFQLYLKGRFYWNKRTPQDLQKAIEYFNQAIAVDPNYALGYAGLADAYAQLSNYRGSPPHEVMPKAKDAALKALSLDNNLAEAHTALGLILHIYDYDFAGAEREHLRAIELNPNYATAHHFYGILLSGLGRHEESLAHLERALEIDPFSLLIARVYGDRLIFARRYDDAITQLKKTLELDADLVQVHFSLAIAYQTKGNHAEAVEEYAKYQEQIGEPQTAAIMREGYSKSGWQGFLRMITEKRIRFNSPLDNLATFYAALGEKDKAFAELNKSYENRENNMARLKVDPRLDPLRDDPRFQELLRKVGFP